MNEPGQYPPPDFGCPPQNSIQPFQHQQPPRSSSFHPSMWSWSETPPEPSWHHSGQAGWHQGVAPGFGFPPGRGNYGPQRPYGQNFGHERHQGGHRGGRQNYGPPNHHRRKQKNEREPDYSHFCDTCDRVFKTQEKYDEHVSQHVKCSVPDCSFRAHEKIVSIHWKNNHAPGAKRIKLDTQDEIIKWREERRKNYPTLQNVEKKRKVLELREETGAVLETAQFGRMRGRNRGWGRGRGRGRGNRGFRGRHPEGPHPSHSGATETPPPHTQRCNDGDPLGALASGDHDSDKEDPAAESRAGGLVVPPKQISSALCSLMASYGSTSDSDEEPEAIQRAKDLAQENQALLNPISPNTPNRGPSVGSKSSSQTREAHNVSQNVSVLHAPHNKRGRRGRRGRGGRRGHEDMPSTRRPTLLEMLLAPDIRHERNVLLQCVRYVVRNKFFGLESRPQKQEGAKEEPTPAIPAEGLEERREKQSEGVEALKEDKRRAVGVDNQGDLGTNKAVLVDQNCQDQGLQSGQVCSEPSEDPVGKRVAGDLDKNGEETAAKGCHGLESTCTDKNTRALDVYDDEIWESPGVM